MAGKVYIMVLEQHPTFLQHLNILLFPFSHFSHSPSHLTPIPSFVAKVFFKGDHLLPGPAPSHRVPCLAVLQLQQDRLHVSSGLNLLEKICSHVGVDVPQVELGEASHRSERGRGSQLLCDKVLERLSTASSRCRLSKSSFPGGRPLQALCAKTRPCWWIVWQHQRIPQGFPFSRNTNLPGRGNGSCSNGSSLETSNGSHLESTRCWQCTGWPYLEHSICSHLEACRGKVSPCTRVDTRGVPGSFGHGG